MKKSNEAMEIEQLKNKIEMYRKALATLKTENTSGDIHLKRRVTILEKNIEKLNGQVEELAQLFDESFAYLSNEVKELAEKWSEMPKEEVVKPQKKPGRIEHTELPYNIANQADPQPKSQQSGLPSFRQLKQIAQQSTIQSNESTKFNTPRYYTSAVPLEHSGIRELEPIINEERKNNPNRVVETPDTLVKSSSSQSNRIQQEEPQPVHRVNQLYDTDENETSPFWKMFKKK